MTIHCIVFNIYKMEWLVTKPVSGMGYHYIEYDI